MIRTFVSRGLALIAVFAIGLLLLPKPGLAVIKADIITSPGGITAWLVSDPTIPMMSIEFAFRGGATLDPEGKEGLARMVAGLLDEGAGDLDSQAFYTRLEELAVSLSFSHGAESITGTLRTLTETRDEAFELLAIALTKPRFDSEPVARVANQIRVALLRDQERPQTIGGRAMFESLFPDHPYGRTTQGTPEGIGAITRDDLVGFVEQRFALDNLVIGVTGDITAEELGPLLDQTFGGLPKTATPWALPEIQPRTGEKIVIEKAVPQSAIGFAQGAVKRDHPDFFPLFVMNHMLGGGGFTSRLYDEVREKRGLAYSVGSYLYTLNHSALILGNAGTQNERVNETLEVIQAEWQKFRNEGVTQEKLDDAKTYLTGSYPLRFSSSGAISGILVGLQLSNIGADYLENRNSFIEAVTLEDVNRVARQYLTPDRLTMVVVGQPDGIPATQ
ncbi:MAG: M16 family metallopeptidase [Magnetovibrionaceae bacterium]